MWQDLGVMGMIRKAAPAHVRGQATQRIFRALYPSQPAKAPIDAPTSTNRLSGGRTCDGAAARRAAFRAGAAASVRVRAGYRPIRPLPVQRLRQIRDQIAGILDPHGQTQQRVGDAALRLDRLAMLHQAFDPAQ